MKEVLRLASTRRTPWNTARMAQILGEDVAIKILDIEEQLAKEIERCPMDERVVYLYNPIGYARTTHEMFMKRYMNSQRDVLFLGMNPGPWGMSQTGVPFGEVAMVRDFLGITGPVDKPTKEHPKRLVQGFACSKQEVSGQRFWSLVKQLCGTPQNFFQSCAVYNMCPVAFMAATGKNLTPIDMGAAYKGKIFELCDEALAQVIEILQVKVIIGIGRFAETRAKLVLKSMGNSTISVHFLNHPSPASARANRNWQELALRQLSEMNVLATITGPKIRG